LNLSPDAPRPPGNWKKIIWQPESMWIARWKDKLSGKTKYVWFSDSSSPKQKKDIEKYEKAKNLSKNLRKVQRHIQQNLKASDIRRRKTATVCFLIDRLKIRVGDEKDPDEADTVGASTLRSEHLEFHDDKRITLNFLGKDSIRHIQKVRLPKEVITNLREFASDTSSPMFEGVDSRRVSEFLDEIVSDLSAKDFRTFYASEAVKKKLKNTIVEMTDPEYLKKHIATLANLEAAIVCNHRRTMPKSWKSSLEKKRLRLKTLKTRAKENKNKYKERIRVRRERFNQRITKKKDKLKETRKKLVIYKKSLVERKQQNRPIKSIKIQIRRKMQSLERLRHNIQKIDQDKKRVLKRIKGMKKKRELKDKITIEKLKMQIIAQQKTRDFNLGTSLKSYIDPRTYYDWGKKVEFDWRNYYPKTLQKKFSWVEKTEFSKVEENQE